MFKLGAWGDAARWEEYDHRQQELANDDSPEEPEYALCEEEDESGDGSVTNAEEIAVDQKYSSSGTDSNVPDHSICSSSSSRRKRRGGRRDDSAPSSPKVKMEREIPYDWMVKRHGTQGNSSSSFSNSSSST